MQYNNIVPFAVKEDEKITVVFVMSSFDVHPNMVSTPDPNGSCHKALDWFISLT